MSKIILRHTEVATYTYTSIVSSQLSVTDYLCWIGASSITLFPTSIKTLSLCSSSVTSIVTDLTYE